MIEVLKTGLYTSIQDLGRYGYRDQGVPLSGVMDESSAKKANNRVGNTKQTAVLECTMVGPKLKFEIDTQVCISGGDFEIWHNETAVAVQNPISIKKGDVLTVGKAICGMRCYVAVSGGFRVPKILGSRSFYKGITVQATIQKGDKLLVGEIPKNTAQVRTLLDTDYTTKEISVYRGAEFDRVALPIRNTILQQEFVLSPNSNRMASLFNTTLSEGAAEIRTAPVQPGTVQLTPSGKLVVLMRDAQVTGGYARVLQLTQQAIAILAQKRAGESVLFVLKELT